MRTVGLALALSLVGSSFALAQTTQPYSRRLVATNNVRVSSAKEDITTTIAEKRFFVPYGGTINVRYQFRSDGSHQTDIKVYVNSAFQCGASTNSATYLGGAASCKVTIPAGSEIRVELVANGQEGAFKDVQLLFNEVDSNDRASVLQN
jgi:hypothetical protein